MTTRDDRVCDGCEEFCRVTRFDDADDPEDRGSLVCRTYLRKLGWDDNLDEWERKEEVVRTRAAELTLGERHEWRGFVAPSDCPRLADLESVRALTEL